MKEISLFDNIKKTTHPTKLTVDTFIKYVKEGKWRDEVESVREKLKTATNKDERGRAKSSLPNATMSGYFEKRGAKNLVKHSGYILIDIDDIQDSIDSVFKQLKKDPYSYAIFKSVSGNGLGVVVKIDPDKHEEAFKALEAYYSFRYYIEVDTACKDVSRTRYVSYDPDTYINKKAEEFRQYIPDKEETKSFDKVDNASLSGEVQRAVDYVLEKDIDITDNYTKWLTVALSLSSSLGEDGREFFHQFSSLNSEYDEKVADLKYDNCLQTGNGSVTIGSLFHLLSEVGFQVDPSINGKGNGIKKVIDYLNQTYDIRYNEISNVIECRLKETDDSYEPINIDDIYVKLKLKNYKVTLIDLKSVVRSEEVIQKYNPVREYFEGLDWNDGNNIEELAAHFKTDDNERFLTQLRKMLVRSIACALEPDTFNKHCLVLHSTGQNVGKTSFWRWLCPAEFRQRYYFEGHLDPQSKDSIMYLGSSFFINLDELASIGKAGINHLKAMLTANGTMIRLPFQPQPQWIQRIATFVGSTNDDDFLIDINNVRWVVIRVDDIDFDYSELDVNQIWAEAYEEYKCGFDYTLSREEIEQNETIADEFKSISTEQELIMKYFEISSKEDGGVFVQNADIASMLQDLNPSIRVNIKYIASEMKKAKFFKYKTKGKWGYWVKFTDDYREDYENRIGSRALQFEKEAGVSENKSIKINSPF